MPPRRHALALLLSCPLALCLGGSAGAQDAALPPPPAPASPPHPAVLPALGSTAFCLFEAPIQNGRRPFVNLAHVQYVEIRDDEVRLFFGGGNLGSGHEARWPIRNRDEAAAIIRRMQDTARGCR